MRYTYLFTQINREENGNLVPVTDNPHEFVFTFGKKIETFLGESPNDTVLLTKDMWKEHPATNEELLKTVCFSTPSQQGFRRPLIMTKEADKRAGVYKYKKVYENEVKEGKCLSDDIRRLTETFVKGVRVINEDKVFIHCEELKSANIKHLMSYVKSEVYKHLLQDKDNRGKERAKEYLKYVLEFFFSFIPDSIIDKFDDGLKAHDVIREKLEGVPENDIATREAVLKSQGYFDTIDDFDLFVVLYKYILSVKNVFNQLVWVIYRSKIGLVSLKDVKKQLSAMFEFVSKVKDNEPMGENEILKEICGGDKYTTVVGDFLRKIENVFVVKDLGRAERAALCYKFHNECNLKYFDSKFKCYDEIAKEYIPFRQERFKDLCLLYWGIEGNNSYKPCKCQKQMEKFSSLYYNEMVWKLMKK